MFWVVLQHLVAAKCTVAKSDPRMPFWHEFRPMKLFSRFSAKMHPINFVWSKAHVLGGFAPFGSRKCTVAKSGPGMPFGHGFGPMKQFLSFPAKMHLLTLLRALIYVPHAHGSCSFSLRVFPPRFINPRNKCITMLN